MKSASANTGFQYNGIIKGSRVFERSMVNCKFLAPFTLLLALVSAACGGGEDSTPQPTPLQLQHASFVNTRLSPGFALHFPVSWRYQVTETGIMLSNHPDLLTAEDDGAAIPSGALAANVSLLTEAEVQGIGARNAAGLIDAFVGSSSSDDLGPRYRNSNVIQIDGRDGAQSLVSIDGSDSLLLALELEGNFVLAVVVAPQGELQRHTPTLNAIFASVELLDAP